MKFSVDIYSRIAHIDHRGEIMHQSYTQEILLKMLHLHYCIIYSGYHHVKTDVLTVPKMCNFLGFKVSEQELLLLKVG